MPSLALATTSGITLARRILLALEGDAGRDAVGAELPLESGRVAQLADSDPDLGSPGLLPGLMLRRDTSRFQSVASSRPS